MKTSRSIASIKPRNNPVDTLASNANVSHVKVLTMREFFHSPTLIKSLQPGQSLTVTSRGKPNVIVTKAGQRPKKTATQMRQEAKALVKPGKKVDSVARLRRLRR